MEKQNILITGSGGFVGNAIKFALMKNDMYTIFAPKSSVLDLMDTRAVEKFFEQNHIDMVYHLAAKHAGVGSGINQPLLFLESNLLMNYNIVSSAIRNHVRKFVALGSSCTYQVNLLHPAKEEDLWNQRAENTYGTCKQVLLEHLQTQNVMNWVYLIPPNLYGPGDHFGEGGTHFIPATVKKFQIAKDSGKKYIEVWGDGKQSRDFLYLRDIINILVEAGCKEKYDGRAINIATGRQVSIRTVVKLLQRNLHLEDIVINWNYTKPIGLEKRELDNTLFLSLNPDYEFVQIEDGIQSTIDWYLDGADSEDVLCYIK